MILTYLIINLMNKIISFASDFGLEDGSVGVVKGVINRIDPELIIFLMGFHLKILNKEAYF